MKNAYPVVLWCLVGLAPALVEAQPLGWAVGPRRLEVVDLATGTLRLGLDAPGDVSFAAGALTPDGRYYLLPTSSGLWRFRTDTLAHDGQIGPSDAVGQVAIASTGTHVHVVGPLGHAVFDWLSGALVSPRCCAGIEALQFTPDGRYRLELAHQAWEHYTLTAIEMSSGATAWSVDLAYQWIEMAVSNTQVVLNTDFSDSRALLVYRIADGLRQAWLPGIAPNSMAWRGDELLVSQIVYVDPPIPSTYRLRLLALDQSGRGRVIADRRPVHSNSTTGTVVLSSDERLAYWLYYDSPTFDITSTTYEIIDLDAKTRVGIGSLGTYVSGLAVEASQPCSLQAPATMAGAIEGGVVGLPIVPDPLCRFWSIPYDPRVLNPGLHSGPATLLVQTWANAGAQPKDTVVNLGSTTVTITQPSGVPAAPVLEAALSDNRVRLEWTPAVGAGISEFVVRGAVAGGPLTDVLMLPGHLRNWASPPLSAGSYQVELVAINGAGRSVASNRRRFSVGLDAAPDPPTSLSAQVSDDRVALSWIPAASEPAPAGFVIEAGAAGSQQWAAVARTNVPRFVATRVPAGSWQVRVRATTAAGVGEPSDAVAVTTTPCSAPPGPPLQTWAIWTAPTVTLRWEPPASGSVDAYVIEVGRAPGQSDVARFTVPGDRLSITEAVSATTAFVRVRARNACGDSGPSIEMPVVTF